VLSWGWAHPRRQWAARVAPRPRVAIMGAARWPIHHRPPRRRGGRAPVPGRTRQWSRPRTLRRRDRQEGHERYDQQQQPARAHRTRRCSADTHANDHSNVEVPADTDSSGK